MSEIKKQRRGGKRSKKAVVKAAEACIDTDVLDAIAALEDGDQSGEAATCVPASEAEPLSLAQSEKQCSSRKRSREDNDNEADPVRDDDEAGSVSKADQSVAAASEPTGGKPVELSLNYDFDSLELSDPTRKALQEIGYARMTEVCRRPCLPWFHQLRNILPARSRRAAFPFASPASTSSAPPRPAPARRWPS